MKKDKIYSKNYSPKERAEKKMLAKYLYVEQGLTLRNISKEVDVTEKTVCNWVNKNFWKVEREMFIAQTYSPDIGFLEKSAQSVNELQVYLKLLHPVLAQQIDDTINQYKQLKKI